MKAFILAAGKGTRLLPLTKKQPKCMIKIHGKTLLDHQVDVLLSCGVDNIYIIAGYLANIVNKPKIQKIINLNYANTNMVYSLFCASEFMTGDEDILVTYGDIVYTADTLKSVILGDAPISVGVDLNWRDYWQARMSNPLDDAETLRLTDGNLVIELGKKPKGYNDIEGQYMGLIKIRAEYVIRLKNFWQDMIHHSSYDRRDLNKMFFTSFLQILIDNGWEVRACFVHGGWLEFDTLEDLAFDHSRFWTPHFS